MIQQGEFSPDISDSDYRIIGGMAITFSAFIGFWDWYHNRGKDTSQPQKIQTQKARKPKEYTERRLRNEWITQDFGSKSNLLSVTEHSFNDSTFVVQLYQIKF